MRLFLPCGVGATAHTVYILLIVSSHFSSFLTPFNNKLRRPENPEVTCTFPRCLRHTVCVAQDCRDWHHSECATLAPSHAACTFSRPSPIWKGCGRGLLERGERPSQHAPDTASQGAGTENTRRSKVNYNMQNLRSSVSKE